MSEKEALEIINKTFTSIFDKSNIYSLEEIKTKFAFDIRLPFVVRDVTTGEDTYASSLNAKKYMRMENAQKIGDSTGWMRPKREVSSLSELIEVWDSVNYITTERCYNCENAVLSDPVYNSTNVYNCTDCGDSDNILFCDGVYKSKYAIACQRSNTLNYVLRVDDSNTVTNSYNVVCSANISNSFFIQDCSNLHECIFCCHISNKEYCISNMQFTKQEYFFLKEKIIEWILAK